MFGWGWQGLVSRACSVPESRPWAREAVRCFGIKARHRGCVYVPRKVARHTLGKARRNQPDDTLLLPPFVSATELRILFRLDYANTMRMLGVRTMDKKYYWKDFEGREFESTSKRKVLVPFDMAATPLRAFGYAPKLVDAEPDWAPISRAANSVPVVAVLGHINHGKTTLLDAFCGTNVAENEPGRITQDVRAMTGIMEQGAMELELPQRPRTEEEQVDGASHEEGSRARRMTFLDTPGHAAFELSRGRTMAAADVALVVISVERGAELQTEEVLMHASKWKVPVVFALNKIDLPDSHLELTRAELRRQCQLLHEHGLVDVDWTREAEEAIPISALYRRNLEALVAKVQATADALPQLPLRPAEPLTITPGEAQNTKNVQRRTDFLVGVEASPSAVALLLEVSKAGEEQGEMVLTALVRAGRLVVGQFFVAGTAFGRITNLSVATGLERNRQWLKCDHAGVGVAVQLTGLRTKKVGGDCAVDDLLFALPRERAWRLCEHRQRIEQLMACQVFGPPLEVAWENDAQIQSRTQAAFERSDVANPEKHAGSAYERRWDQPAVEEVSLLAKPAFSEATRRDFQAPLQVETREPSRAPREPSPPALASRFQVLQPTTEGAEAAEDEEVSETSARSGGRRSRRRLTGSGAWSEDPENVKPKQEFIYYTDRQSWDEEAEIDTKRLQARWQGRDQDRWEEMRRQEQMRKDEAEMVERVRKEAFGEAAPEEDDAMEDTEEGDAEGPAVPLPHRKVNVIPIILKTKSVSQFDMLMEEIDKVQEAYGLRIVIVHGGLGPVIPKDIVHAEVEKRYGYCPVYAFQVGANPSAVGQADAEQIDIRRFDVFTELIDDLVERCERIRQKRSLQRYAASLRHEPAGSGYPSP